jgi:hypothetical protein
MSLWWRIWHIYRWRAIAMFFGAINQRIHDRFHETTDPSCDRCLDRENEA